MMDHRAQHLDRVDELVVEFDGSLRRACSRIATHEWREGKLEERISGLEPYQRACRWIQQWIGCDDQEVDDAVVARVEGDARKIAALEAREAELVDALKAAAPFVSTIYWNECEDFDATCDSCLAVRARKKVEEALAKARGDVSDG